MQKYMVQKLHILSTCIIIIVVNQLTQIKFIIRSQLTNLQKKGDFNVKLHYFTTFFKISNKNHNLVLKVVHILKIPWAESCLMVA